MKRRQRTAKKFEPKTALERKLYAFYVKWMAWHDAYDKARSVEVSEEDWTTGSEKYKEWCRQYDADHPKPPIPNDMRIDFNERTLGGGLFRRLVDGYYRTPKVVVVAGEYGTSTWLIKKHSDFGSVAVDIVKQCEEVFKAYPSKHRPRPPEIDKAVLDGLPEEYREEMVEKSRRELNEWIEHEKSIARCEKINELLERAKKGDHAAAADLVCDKIHDRSYYGSDPRISVHEFENVKPN